MLDIPIACTAIAASLLFLGGFAGVEYARQQARKMFEDTPEGDSIRELYGLHLEFTYTEPHSGVEVARVVSQWHEYQGA